MNLQTIFKLINSAKQRVRISINWLIFSSSKIHMKKLLLLSAALLSLTCSYAQKIDPVSIDIVRDSFGVPHIFANTDAEVAYGLAYAHAEDDFKTIQLGFLSGKSMLRFFRKSLEIPNLSRIVSKMP